MAKITGNNRTLTTEEMSSLHEEVMKMNASGKYSKDVEEFNGGYLAIEKSSKKHSKDEEDAARFIAKNGNKVILKNEAGSKTTIEGWINGKKYEQKTPTGSDATNFENALRHARDKKAEIAVVYTKNANYTLEIVEDGIKNFETNSKYRFHEIIVVTKDGRVHHHVHNS